MSDLIVTGCTVFPQKTTTTSSSFTLKVISHWGTVQMLHFCSCRKISGNIWVLDLHTEACNSVCASVSYSPREIVDPYPVLVNHNARGHHPNKDLCVALVLKKREQCVCVKEGVCVQRGPRHGSRIEHTHRRQQEEKRDQSIFGVSALTAKLMKTDSMPQTND